MDKAVCRDISAAKHARVYLHSVILIRSVTPSSTTNTSMHDIYIWHLLIHVQVANASGVSDQFAGCAQGGAPLLAMSNFLLGVPQTPGPCV